jgi:hypothetical protein
MVKRLTLEEQLIREQLATVRGYPRWKWVYYTKGLIYYIHSGLWVREVFKRWDGRWSTGSKDGGTFRYFESLQAALAYGVKLAQPKIAFYRNGWVETRLCGVSSPIVPPPDLTVTRLGSDSEKQRLNDIALQ